MLAMTQTGCTPIDTLALLTAVQEVQGARSSEIDGSWERVER